MQIIKQFVVALLVMVTGCGPRGGFTPSVAAPKEPLRGGVLEFHLSSYDGRVLEGRVLVGATVDSLVLDDRLTEWTDVELENLRACDKTEPISYLFIDIFTSDPRAEHRVMVRPGSWYGGTVSFLLFDEHTKNVGLACFEGDLVVRAMDFRIAGKLPIRIDRTDIPAPQKDPGTEAPKPPSLSVPTP